MDFLYGKRPVWQASDVEKVVLKRLLIARVRDGVPPVWAHCGATG